MIDIEAIIKEFIEGTYNNTDYPTKYSVCESLKNRGKYSQYIYNEFSLQHELGNYLRYKLNKETNGNFEYFVIFEYNINELIENNSKIDTCKREIDILIIKYNTKKGCTEKKYAIELKYLKNEAYPYRMFQCIKDMRFMNDVLEAGIDESYCVVVTENRGFYESTSEKNKHLHENKKLLSAYKNYEKSLNEEKERLLKNLGKNNKELKKINKQIEMVEEIINANNKDCFPIIYKYFRDSNCVWERGKYIYSNLINKLDIIDINDFNKKMKFEWYSVNKEDINETNKYYILKFEKKHHNAIRDH